MASVTYNLPPLRKARPMLQHPSVQVPLMANDHSGFGASTNGVHSAVPAAELDDALPTSTPAGARGLDGEGSSGEV